MGIIPLLTLLASLSSSGTSTTLSAEDVRVFEHPELSMVVLEAQVPLPGQGWRVIPAERETANWAQVQLHTMQLDTTQAPGLHRIGALWVGDQPGADQERFSVRLRSSETGEARTISIDPAAAQAGDAEIFRRWATQRAMDWQLRARHAPGSILSMWLSRHQAVYDVAIPPSPSQRRGAARSTSVFNVLGGRAAIRETLQLQALEENGSAGEEETVSLREIPGVTVVSHPFEEMLAGRPGGSVPLADLAPPDRFFVYFSRPETLAGYLGGGAQFLHQTSSTFTSSTLDHDLMQKTFWRLGLTVEMAKTLLESRAITDVAVLLPDLFLIDGTDVTVIFRVPNPERLAPILTLVGVRGLESGGIVEQSLPGKASAYWARRGELFFLGTHRGEVENCLRLEETAGEGSLGRSAEFRYMLTKLPLEERSLAYAYLSDPFIRRLVGPEVKIGQLRRMRARADLEMLSAGALLHRLDHSAGEPTVENLAQLGYIPERFERAGYSLDSRGVGRSSRYGSASELSTLTRVPLDRVRPSEAAAYDRYRENYTAFWRQFFDPIALRLDAPAPGEFELNVFILPLIDSSIYEQVRVLIEPHGTGRGLEVPRLSPEPVLLLSANLREEAWQEMVGDFGDLVARIGVSKEVFQHFRPAIHFAVQDGDPVIHFGSGDIFGAFGGGGAGLVRQREMLLLPVALSAFTRPCQFLIPLDDPDAVIRILSRTQNRTPDRQRFPSDFVVDWVRIEGENRWILTSRIFNTIQLRYGIAVDQGHLVISNIPWLPAAEIRGSEPRALSGATIRVAPGAGEQQLAGLFTAAVEGERVAAQRSAMHLHPLMLVGGTADVAEAGAWHARLFGFRPLHPGRGGWEWSDGELTSSRFGNLWQPRQPGYVEGDHNFGVMRQVESLSASMQLEDDGLRTRFSWTLRQEP